MLTEDQTDWFIEVDGHLKGPYPSKELAEATLLTEGLNGKVVPKTKDGKSFLMG